MKNLLLVFMALFMAIPFTIQAENTAAIVTVSQNTVCNSSVEKTIVVSPLNRFQNVFKEADMGFNKQYSHELHRLKNNISHTINNRRKYKVTHTLYYKIPNSIKMSNGLGTRKHFQKFKIHKREVVFEMQI